MDALLLSDEGAAAIRDAIRGECRVIVSLPDVQHFFEVRWWGCVVNEEMMLDDESSILTLSTSRAAIRYQSGINQLSTSYQ